MNSESQMNNFVKRVFTSHRLARGEFLYMQAKGKLMFSQYYGSRTFSTSTTRFCLKSIKSVLVALLCRYIQVEWRLYRGD